jgi:hypothetical protein
MWSSHHDSKNAKFPKEPWIVDRTSAWEQAGGYALNVFGGELPIIDNEPIFPTCAEMNARDIFEPGQFIVGCLWSERQRTCADLIMSAYFSIHCPPYGKAYTGVCASSVMNVVLYCLSEDVEGVLDDLFDLIGKIGKKGTRKRDSMDPFSEAIPKFGSKSKKHNKQSRISDAEIKRTLQAYEESMQGDTTGFVYDEFAKAVKDTFIRPAALDGPVIPARLDLLLALAVRDDDPHCLNEFPVKTSGRVQRALGLHKSLDEVWDEVVYKIFLDISTNLTAIPYLFNSLQYPYCFTSPLLGIL